MAQAIILMGVSGSGKTTVGELLAHALGWPFYDADNFHSPANVERMRRGVALTDAERGPWLAALARLIGEALANDQSLVLGCSALKEAYRTRLKPPCATPPWRPAGPRSSTRRCSGARGPTSPSPPTRSTPPAAR